MAIMTIKESVMKTISASQVKQNSTILQDALRGDLLITKRDKPFVVVVDYERYQTLISSSNKPNSQDWMNETFGVIDEKESKELLDTIYNGRVNKE